MTKVSPENYVCRLADAELESLVLIAKRIEQRSPQLAAWFVTQALHEARRRDSLESDEPIEAMPLDALDFIGFTSQQLADALQGSSIAYYAASTHALAGFCWHVHMLLIALAGSRLRG